MVSPKIEIISTSSMKFSSRLPSRSKFDRQSLLRNMALKKVDKGQSSMKKLGKQIVIPRGLNPEKNF